METFKKENYDNAKEFMIHNARPLERTVFEYLFEHGSKEKALEELKKFQNPDGGFGHGIEPDFWLSHSSPMATETALHYMKWLDVDYKNHMLEKAIIYLINNLDYKKLLWVSTPKEVNNEPHAPWWHYNEEKEERNEKDSWGNPNAEILAFLYDHKELVPEEMLLKLTDRAIKEINLKDYEIEMHDLISYTVLYESLPDTYKEKMYIKLESLLENTIEKNPAEWDNYTAKPLMYITTPESEFYEKFKTLTEINIEYEIKKQSEDGSWEPTWQWGQMEEAWLKAKKMWKGVLTLKNLIIFKNFDIIEK